MNGQFAASLPVFDLVSSYLRLIMSVLMSFRFFRSTHRIGSAVGKALSSTDTIRTKPGSRCRQRAYTLIELLAVTFIMLMAMVAEESIAKRYGRGWGIVAAGIAVVASAGLVVLWYRWMWRRNKARLRELKEKYRSIYRVVALPGDKSGVVKLAGAELKVGDFGWEAVPIRKDGLTHLQGLTPGWNVVWHAAFRPDEIQLVGAKPSSQYDYWVPYWAKSPPPPPCPFPILARETPAMGRPMHSMRYFASPGQYLERG
ncbi:MAG TPA: hypothetical protein VH595_07945 [Verrucomicrobiae bacterium]|nr:hypothetical protein [Verrucomicrobiae bacterium]